jgi:hypothetical protein
LTAKRHEPRGTQIRAAFVEELGGYVEARTTEQGATALEGALEEIGFCDRAPGTTLVMDLTLEDGTRLPAPKEFDLHTGGFVVRIGDVTLRFGLWHPLGQLTEGERGGSRPRL